jgi:hypothetical protein
MADYPTLAATLSALAATETDPTGAESAAKLNDAIVQTRVWLGDFLSQVFTDVGKLKPYAIDADVIPAGTVRGSNPVGDVQREILQRSIRAIDITLESITSAELAAAAVTTAKIADEAVTAAKLATGAFTSDKIGTQAITTDKIAASAITTPLLATDAVQTTKIKDENVTTAKVALRAIDGSRLPAGTAGQVLVGGNTVNGQANSFKPVTLSGVITVDADGVTTFASDAADATAFAIVAESGAPSGTAGGLSKTADWCRRGANLAPAAGSGQWIIEKDPSGLVNINGSYIEFKKDGAYRISVSCPAYKVSGHMIRATVKKDAVAADTQVFYGSSEYASNANLGQTRSQMDIIVNFSGATDTVFPYMYIDHYTDIAIASEGLGKNVGAGVNERYAIVSIFKLL